MAETSCQSLRMLSDQRALSAQAVVSCFVKKTLNSKNTRRLQTLSIQHCITRRLRTAFSSFKKLLSRTVRLTARDWHRHRFLSSVFGRWLTYVNDEKHIESTLLGQGYSFFRMVRFKQLKTAYHRSQVRRQNCHRRIRLGIAYFSYLSLLRSFETLTVRKQAKCSARSSYYSAERLHYSKCASRVICETPLQNIHSSIDSLLTIYSVFVQSHLLRQVKMLPDSVRQINIQQLMPRDTN